MAKQGKIKTNDQWIQEQRAEGREHCFKSQLPYPSAVSRCTEVLATNGNVVYFKEARSVTA